MTVQIENRDNGIRIVRLTGAAASKSFSRESLPIIAQAIDDGLSDQSVRAMIITGEGKFFSAGADIHAFQEAIDANDAPQLIRDLTNILHPLLIRIRQSSTIVVGAIIKVTGNWDQVLILFGALYLASALCWWRLRPDGTVFDQIPDAHAR